MNIIINENRKPRIILKTGGKLPKSFDTLFYISKTCHKKYQKDLMSCQAVSNMLEVWNVPTEFENMHNLEKFLIAKHMLFKKAAIIPCIHYMKSNVFVKMFTVNIIFYWFYANDGNIIFYVKGNLKKYIFYNFL